MSPLPPVPAPDPLTATTPERFVERLRALKAWKGLTYRQLQRQAAQRGSVLPHSTIASVLGRPTLPRLEFVEEFTGACGLPADQAADWVSAWRRLAVRQAADPPPVPPEHRAAELSRLDVRRLAASTRRLRHLDDRYGGSAIVDHAIAVQGRSRNWLRHSTRHRADRSGLLRVLAEDAINTGWICSAAGRGTLAARYCAEGLDMARTAGARDLEVYALSHMVSHARQEGRVSESLEIVQIAQRVGRGAVPPRVMSMLAAREASGHARLGDRTAFQRAMGDSLRWFAYGPGDGCPDWCGWFGAAALTRLAAECSEKLGDLPAAADRYGAAVAVPEPRYERNRLRAQALFASCLLTMGETDKACLQALRCLEQAAEQITDANIDRALARFRRRLAGSPSAAAADFIARFDDLFAVYGAC